MSESGREICYRLSTDNNAMDYTLVIGLDEALRVLTARVSAGGHDIASLTIAALDKTAIAPLDTEGAVQLDMAFLMNLIAEAQRSGQASYAASTTAERPAAVARAEEAAEEAVEEAVEEAAEAVEEAAEEAAEEAIEEAAAEAAEEAVEEAAPESPIGG